MDNEINIFFKTEVVVEIGRLIPTSDIAICRYHFYTFHWPLKIRACHRLKRRSIYSDAFLFVEIIRICERKCLFKTLNYHRAVTFKWKMCEGKRWRCKFLIIIFMSLVYRVRCGCINTFRKKKKMVIIIEHLMKI